MAYTPTEDHLTSAIPSYPMEQDAEGAVVLRAIRATIEGLHRDLCTLEDNLTPVLATKDVPTNEAIHSLIPGSSPLVMFLADCVCNLGELAFKVQNMTARLEV